MEANAFSCRANQNLAPLFVLVKTASDLRKQDIKVDLCGSLWLHSLDCAHNDSDPPLVSTRPAEIRYRPLLATREKDSLPWHHTFGISKETAQRVGRFTGQSRVSTRGKVPREYGIPAISYAFAGWRWTDLRSAR